MSSQVFLFLFVKCVFLKRATEFIEIGMWCLTKARAEMATTWVRKWKQPPRKSCNATPESITAKPQKPLVVGRTRGRREGGGREAGCEPGWRTKLREFGKRIPEYDAKNSYISILLWRTHADLLWKQTHCSGWTGDSARAGPDCLLLPSDSLRDVLTRKKRFPFQSASTLRTDAAGPMSLIFERAATDKLANADWSQWAPADRKQPSSAESSRGWQTFHPLTLETLAGPHRGILFLCRSNKWNQGKLLLPRNEKYACFSAMMSCFCNKFKAGKRISFFTWLELW